METEFPPARTLEEALEGLEMETRGLTSVTVTLRALHPRTQQSELAWEESCEKVGVYFAAVQFYLKSTEELAALRESFGRRLDEATKQRKVSAFAQGYQALVEISRFADEVSGTGFDLPKMHLRVLHGVI